MAPRCVRVLVTVSVALAGALPVSGGGAEEVLLIQAVKERDVAAVRARLSEGVDVNATEPDGATALHWAAHDGQADLARILLDAGAEVNATTRYGVQAVSLAAENGQAAILDELLRRGADPNAALPGGETVLMTAARSGSVDAVRLLLVNGADPDVREPLRGQTPLMWAAARNNAAAIHVLTELGADVHAVTDPAIYPPNGSVFSDPPPTGFTALIFAARGGHLDALTALLEAGADINDTVSDGQSALVVAVANANWDLADYLLDRGADPRLAGAGWNALHQAVRTRRMNIGFGTPGPILQGEIDSINVVEKIIDNRVDVNARMTTAGMKDGQRNRLNRLGATAFFLASKVTDVEVMRVLLAAGADPLMPNADGTTPLMVAAGVAIWNPGEDGGSLPGQEDEVLEAVRLLVEQGNDVNAANYRGETPLHGAAFRGANNVVEYLVQQGAQLDARTTQGWTPLAIANGLSYSDFY